MAEFIIEKLDWEYGEKYGHVFYPKNEKELLDKIDELDQLSTQKDYPHLIRAHFRNGNYRIGFTVGHEWSFLEFVYLKHNNEFHSSMGHFYLENQEGCRDEIIPVYLMSSYTEPDTTKMLPKKKVIDAFLFFVKNEKFPPFIKLDENKANETFVTRQL